MKAKRNIYFRYYSVLPVEKMTGKLDIPYSGELIFAYDQLPEDFDWDLDWEITCDCDLGEIRSFVHI